MALVDGGVGGQAIEVFIAFDVPDPNAFTSAEDYVERVIVMSAEAVFESYVICGREVLIHPRSPSLPLQRSTEP